MEGAKIKMKSEGKEQLIPLESVSIKTEPFSEEGKDASIESSGIEPEQVASIKNYKVAPKNEEMIASSIDIVEHPVKMEDEQFVVCCTLEQNAETSDHQEYAHGFEFINVLATSDNKRSHQMESTRLKKKVCYKKTTATDESPFVCSNCGKNLFDLKQFEIHILECGVFQCDQCQNVYSTKNAMVAHLKRVHFPKNAFCHLCNKGYYNNFYLKQHLHSKHSSEQKYQCTMCNKRYQIAGALKLHVDSVHKNIQFKCELCDKRYRTKQGLGVHHQVVHENTVFICDVCSSSFSCYEYLKQHKRTHGKVTSRIVKPKPKPKEKDGKIMRFRCNFCNRKFFHECMYNAHLMIHKDDK